jgi:D-arabinose 5-phosphate isomerase GutQ
MTVAPAEVTGKAPVLEARLEIAAHVLQTEAKALSYLARLYQSDSIARRGFSEAVDLIRQAIERRGKVVVVGVGKSGHIANKLVATMNSLSIRATFLHPTEALHGDLGTIDTHDVLLFLTFSGRTPELLSLIPHLPPANPVVVLTAHTHPSTCALIDARPDAVLLPAPIPSSETASFGVSAPTTSTTTALALGDALVLAISRELHASTSSVFASNHPGGAIGRDVSAPKAKAKLADLAVPLSQIPFVGGGWGTALAKHVIISGYQSESGWVRYCENSVVPPRRIRRLEADDMEKLATKVRGLVVTTPEWIVVREDISVREAIAFLEAAKAESEHGKMAYDDDAVIATAVEGKVTGVVEIATLMAARETGLVGGFGAS